MWWNGRFTSWMCSRQICSNCMMLSCQYGPKSLRNVSNNLINLCHEELRQFWKQKGVELDTSKEYLIKWPVSVYMSRQVTFIYIALLTIEIVSKNLTVSNWRIECLNSHYWIQRCHCLAYFSLNIICEIKLMIIARNEVSPTEQAKGNSGKEPKLPLWQKGE